jgi:hypothetical protein
VEFHEAVETVAGMIIVLQTSVTLPSRVAQSGSSRGVSMTACNFTTSERKPRGFGWDVGERADPLDLRADRVRVVTLVGVQDLARRKPHQKFCARGGMGNSAARGCERERTAFYVR